MTNLAKSNDSNSAAEPGLSFAIPARPADPLFGVNQLFKKDQSPLAVNGSVGVYQNSQGYTAPFATVRKAELQLAEELQQELLATSNAAKYLPIEGHEGYRSQIQELLFGSDSEVVSSKRAATLQGLGGTGSLSIGARTLQTIAANTGSLPWFSAKILVSDPTWANHKNIFAAAGYEIGTYPYYDDATHTINFEGMKQSLLAADAGTVVLLHGCCHNPTGADISTKQWDELVQICGDRHLFPFIDIAYQGFGESLEADAYGVRAFAASGQAFCVANSLSKILGLYNQRTGSITFVTANETEAAAVLSHAKGCVRSIYSNPPMYGANVAYKVLSDSALRAEWELELSSMKDRIKQMRKEIYASLDAGGYGARFAHLLSGNGMFSMTGLNSEQVEQLRNAHHVYMPGSGRLCMATLNSNNIGHVATSILAVL